MREKSVLDKYRRRVKWISIPVLIFTIVLLGRLFLIQVLERGKYQEYARRQVENRVVLQPVRGTIYDRNGIPLTLNTIHYSFGAHPHLIQDKALIAQHFADIFQKPASYYLEKLNSDRAFIWLERNVRKEKCLSLVEKDYTGIVTIASNCRTYPYREITSHLVGFTSVDNRGLAGIEYKFDGYLSGKPGWTILQLDGWGRSQRSPRYPRVNPVNGNDLYLTIDIDYQTILYEELGKVYEESGADRAMGIIMNPGSGEILAITAIPSFDSNQPYRSSSVRQKNPIISTIFEPGSTMKIVTAVSALEYSVKRPDDIIYCENGRIAIEDRIVRDWKKFGWLTFQQIIEKSSNVGVIKISQELGSHRLYKYLRRFGFGVKTGVSLPGEEEGLIREIQNWTDLTTAQVSIGHGVSVTALQLASAYSAIANGGYLLKPLIISRILSPEGFILYTEEPELIRRVAKSTTMEKMKDILHKTVVYGTGRHAAIDGIEIGGKTGTAQKIVDGKYSDTDYIASFVGFLPVDNPRLLCAVIVDNPRGVNHTGGAVAAPVVRKVFNRIINLSDNLLIADERDESFERELPETRLMSIMESSPTKSGIFPILLNLNRNNKEVVVPNLKGLSLREALLKIQKARLLPEISGTGVVIKQSPAPGTTVAPYSECTIILKSEKL